MSPSGWGLDDESTGSRSGSIWARDRPLTLSARVMVDWVKPPEPFDYVALTVVPPKALGVEDPPPPKPQPTKRQEAPPPPAPKKEESKPEELTATP